MTQLTHEMGIYEIVGDIDQYVNKSGKMQLIQILIDYTKIVSFAWICGLELCPTDDQQCSMGVIGHL